VDDLPLAVDGLTVPLRGFRKSHHFVLASPDPHAQDHKASAAAAAQDARLPVRRVRIAVSE
jgi:hypothetical protein